MRNASADYQSLCQCKKNLGIAKTHLPPAQMQGFLPPHYLLSKSAKTLATKNIKNIQSMRDKQFRASPANSRTLYIFSLHYQQYFLYFCSNYSSKLLKEQGEGRNPLHLSKRKVCFDNYKKKLVLAIRLIVCWSTSRCLPLPPIPCHLFIYYTTGSHLIYLMTNANKNL